MTSDEPLPDEVVVRLTSAEALVLFDMLHDHEDTDLDYLPIRNKAEQIALWSLSCVLETILVEPFEENYDELVAAAHEEGGPLGPSARQGSIGVTVDRIGRMFYVNQGERLAVDEHAWVDPFESDLDEANREFVARSGKWTAFDVSDEAPYDAFIGVRVDAIPSRAATGVRSA